MATLSLTSAGDISLVNDWGKLQSYLYQLRRSLEYMFNNLTPDENYSDEARLIYVADKEKQSAIEVSLDHISLSMVDKDNVISAINLSEEGVKIQGDRIQMEGVVTVNSYFKIGMDGSIEAVNGRFSGDITASNMSSSSITLGGSGNAGKLTVLNGSGTVIGSWDNTGISVKAGSLDIRRGSNIGLYCNGNRFQFGDFYVDDEYGRQILQSSDECTGMSGEPNVSGGLYLWAGYDVSDDSYKFAVNDAGAYTVYGNLPPYNIGEEIYKLWQAIGGGGGGCTSDSCSSDGGGCGCDGDSWVPCGCDGDCEVICSGE